ncbi:MAG: SBBP repeat-containing protein [Bacteroidetes bacterium]|nr:SBBP repeat-containing protein [Bacteroidota bacterium]
MKFKYPLLLIFILINTMMSAAQVPGWEWALSAGHFTTARGTGVAIGENGNVYATGFFSSSTIIFGNDTLSNLSTTGGNNIFIAKYDSMGNVLWSERAGGTGHDEGTSIAADANGNIYLAGTFDSPTLAFDTILLNNAGGFDSFLTKYDSTGHVTWAVRVGGLSDDKILSVAIDRTGSGNVYVTGWFESDTLRIGNFILHNPNIAHEDLFIAKYDSSGNVIWAERFGGPSVEIGSGIATSIDGNVYVSGSFAGTGLVIGSTVLNNNGYEDMLVMMCDSAGNVMWAKSAGGIFYDQAASLVCDNTNNVYVTGYFESPTIIFGNDTLSHAGTRDIFIVKYDSTGNVVWSNRAGGTDFDDATCITSDEQGNVFITGASQSPVISFDSITIATNGLYPDIFVAKYDPSSGNVLWAVGAGGTGWDGGFGLAAHHSGRENVYATGVFWGAFAHFGNTDLSSSTWNGDYFIAKIGEDLLNVVGAATNEQPVLFYPNPFMTSTNFYFTSQTESMHQRLIVTDLFGRKLMEYAINKNPVEVQRNNGN